LNSNSVSSNLRLKRLGSVTDGDRPIQMF